MKSLKSNALKKAFQKINSSVGKDLDDIVAVIEKYGKAPKVKNAKKVLEVAF